MATNKTTNRVRLAAWAWLIALLPIATLHAQDSIELSAWRICAREASQTYGVPLIVLTLLYDMEGGRLGAETPNRNKDGDITSYDIGPMQINSQHLRKLEGYGISRKMLRESMCVNVHVAAWLIRDLMARHPRIVDAVAYYHSPTPYFQAIYLKRATQIVERRLAEIGGSVR